MSCSITLHFPFRLDGREYKVQVQSGMVRKENVVTFSLPLSALVSVSSEKAYTVFYSRLQEKNSYAVTIDFKSINDAIAFHSSPEVHLSYREMKKPESVDKKLEEVASLLEKTGSSWKKRRKCSEPDEEGFITV